MKKIINLLLVSVLIGVNFLHAQDLTAIEIIKKADMLMKGESSVGSMTVKIIRPKWERTISIKTWSKGMDYSLTLVTAPAKEKGQTFLKRNTEMWSWNPKISRMIKLPPSMMSQGWMGSDYSNDDLLKESSIVVDYNHSIEKKEIVNGVECYKVILLPKEESAVIWGKVIKWIGVKNYFQIKTENYDEDGYLVRTELSYDIKKMDDREIPTRMEIIPEDDEGNKTVFYINEIKFNENLNESFFSQQMMKRIR